MKRILIVEDDFFIRDIYSRIFSISGFEVQVAADGLEGLEKVKGQVIFDIILMDIMMPNMSGIELLKAIREIDAPVKDTSVFMITNLGQQDIIDKAFRLGMDGFILKSQVTPKQIVDEVNSFFARKEVAAFAESGALKEKING